jgi:hypothetical protein
MTYNWQRQWVKVTANDGSAYWGIGGGLGTDGYGHVVTGDWGAIDNVSVVYAYEDAVGWHVERIWGWTEHIALATMVLGANNVPHAVWYLEESPYTLYYARRIDGAWDIENIASGVSGNTTLPAIALDPNGYPHILYQKPPNWRHIYKDGTGWHDEIVEGVSASHDPGLAIDASGVIHIVIGTTNLGDWYHWGLRYGYRDGTGWHMENAVTHYGVDCIDCTVTSDGIPYLVYKDIQDVAGNYVPYVAYKLSGTWHTVKLDTRLVYYSYIKCTVDAADTVHVVYALDLNRSNQAAPMIHAYGSLDSWTLEDIQDPHWYIGQVGITTQGNNLMAFATTSGVYAAYIRKSIGRVYTRGVLEV